MVGDVSDRDRRHAADQLGVPPEADPVDARAAFLRRLPAAGFCPPPPLCAAAACLAGRPVPGASGVLAEPDDDDALAADVNTFAREFWSLRPEARRGRWQDLVDRSAADPRLLGRLRRLEAGVDLRDATGVPGPQRQRDVVGMIQTLFVLRPIDRAARRRELLDALPPPTAAWEQAARHVERDLPAHAALEPALVERLATWSRRAVTPAAAAVGRPAPTWGFQTQGGLSMPHVRPVIHRPARRQSPLRTIQAASGVILFFVFLIGRLTSPWQTGSSANTPFIPPAPPPSVSWPVDAPAANSPLPPAFQPGVGDHSAIDDFLRELRNKPEPPAPPGPERP